MTNSPQECTNLEPTTMVTMSPLSASVDLHTDIYFNLTQIWQLYQKAIVIRISSIHSCEKTHLQNECV